ncbi:Cytochrome bo(3) ubiquinol oxidase subunit 3 [Buchnera aphidicola (Thelaxes suberi)]|uniref:cytochrome c oxidase subunit 3 n=1 Tax=Buchnera aphidicola TaxID=9 RepID=UPI0034641C70
MIKNFVSINNEKTSDKLIKLNEKKMLGFWLYLMSDFIIFACVFAVYFVIRSHSVLDSTLLQIKCNLDSILIETILLLCSSVTCGVAVIAMSKQNIINTYIWIIATFIFGLSFVCIEFNEILYFFKMGMQPSSHGFFSSVITLLSMHIAHVIIGLIWMICIILQNYYFKINSSNYTNLVCLSFFWHFLDIIWIILYTFIYFIGFNV